jgi:hypothetical protein
MQSASTNATTIDAVPKNTLTDIVCLFLDVSTSCQQQGKLCKHRAFEGESSDRAIVKSYTITASNFRMSRQSISRRRRRIPDNGSHPNTSGQQVEPAKPRR